MPIAKSGPVGLEAVRKELGENKTDTVTLCTSPKINPKAKYKPYKVDTPKELSNDPATDPRANMEILMDGARVKAPYCLYPEGFDFKPQNFTGKPWHDAWSLENSPYRPKAGVDWCRLTDFAGYNRMADNFIHSVELYTNNPNDPNIPMGPNSNGDPGRIYADIQVSPTEGGLTLNDFPDLRSMYYTLLFGHCEGADPFDAEIYAAQAGPVSDVTTAQQIRLVVDVDSEVYNSILNGGGGNDQWNTMIVCLAPKLTFKSGSQQITSSIDFSKLISLDMWNDGFVQARFNEKIDQFAIPPVSAYRRISAFAAPTSVSLSLNSYKARRLEVDVNEQLPKITIESDINSRAGYNLTEMDIKLVVRLIKGSSRAYFSGDWYTPSCHINKDSDGVDVLSYNNSPGEGVSTVGITIPSSVAAGTYTVEVAVLLTAKGIYYNSSENKTYQCYVEGRDTELQDPWTEGSDGELPEGIYTESVNIGTITIS